MLDRMTYTNHLGELFEFGKDGLYANYSDVRDYEWNYDRNNNKISNFAKGVITKQLPFIVYAENGQELRNKLYEIADKDVQAKIKGTLTIGEYYLKCYINSISNANYLINKQHMTGVLGICTDEPYWHYEKAYSYSKQDGQVSDGFEYPYDFPFDYAAYTQPQQELNNQFAFASDFIITVYGSASGVEIIINDHLYKVNTTLSSNDVLIIDSLKKTITRRKNDGTTINEFNNRYKEQSVFEKIPSGISTVQWDGTFGFDILLIDNRSEPKWGD